MTTVIVVATYPAVRAGLRAMLDGTDGVVVAGEITPAALAAAEGLETADVLVVDLDEGHDPRLVLGELPAELPAVLLAAGPDDFRGIVAETPRAFLLKDATAEELAAAVQAVARGLLVLDPAVARTALAAPQGGTLRTAPDEPLEPLTDRELEVLRLLALGLPNKGIALRLAISEHTVKFHVGAILAKLNAAGRTEAVMLAARRGLLPL
jgi:DNA-binding NarL/FixJ family response regulator